jgi:MYXO-CTERM domain-containing protein
MAPGDDGSSPSDNTAPTLLFAGVAVLGFFLAIRRRAAVRS